jgi:hypothetical protein
MNIYYHLNHRRMYHQLNTQMNPQLIHLMNQYMEFQYYLLLQFLYGLRFYIKYLNLNIFIYLLLIR